MAETAVVNPRRRRRRKRNQNPRRRRRRHTYGAARRRRNPGYAFENPRRRRRRGRRRNPGYAMSNARRSRRSNPGMGGDLFDLSRAIHVAPPATVGVMLGRWVTKFAGEFEADATGVKKPGIKHAIALLIGSKVGGDLVGSLFGDPGKGEIAEIAALGFAGDLFARKNFFARRPGEAPGWIEQNLYLDGFEQESALGEEYVDAAGQRYVRGPQGWQLAGGFGQAAPVELPQEYPPGTILSMPDGSIVQVQGDDEDEGVDGFEERSPLGEGYGSVFGA